MVRAGGTVDAVIRSYQFHTFSNDMHFAIHGCYVIDVSIDYINTYIRQNMLFTVVVVIVVIVVIVSLGVL